MSSQPEIQSIDVHVRVDDIFGPLGYKSAADVAPAILRQIEEESARCANMFRPQFIASLTSLDGGRLHPASADKAIREDEFLSKHLDGVLVLAAGICTLGPEIDAHIDACFAGGDFFGAMIADVVASRAVEEAGERCSDYLCTRGTELELSALCRISPGYGQWDVSGQRTLFSLLDPAPIGVSLNDYCMMQPKKSVSFLIPLGEGRAALSEPSQKLSHFCQECTFRNCAYRRRS